MVDAVQQNNQDRYSNVIVLGAATAGAAGGAAYGLNKIPDAVSKVAVNSIIDKSKIGFLEGDSKKLAQNIADTVEITRKSGVKILKKPKNANNILDGASKKIEEITKKMPESYKNFAAQVNEVASGNLKELKNVKFDEIAKDPVALTNFSRDIFSYGVNVGDELAKQNEALLKPIIDKGFFKAPEKEIGSKLMSAVKRTPIVWATIGAAVLGGAALVANSLLSSGKSPEPPEQEKVRV